jgi:hypothetical protein
VTQDNSEPGVPDAQPTVTEFECGTITFIAHHTLNAVEITVTAPDGFGYRTWLGAAEAPAAALHFCAATVRLIEGIAP